MQLWPAMAVKQSMKGRSPAGRTGSRPDLGRGRRWAQASRRPGPGCGDDRACSDAVHDVEGLRHDVFHGQVAGGSKREGRPSQVLAARGSVHHDGQGRCCGERPGPGSGRAVASVPIDRAAIRLPGPTRVGAVGSAKASPDRGVASRRPCQAADRRTRPASVSRLLGVRRLLRRMPAVRRYSDVEDWRRCTPQAFLPVPARLSKVVPAAPGPRHRSGVAGSIATPCCVRPKRPRRLPLPRRPVYRSRPRDGGLRSGEPLHVRGDGDDDLLQLQLPDVTPVAAARTGAPGLIDGTDRRTFPRRRDCRISLRQPCSAILYRRHQSR